MFDSWKVSLTARNSLRRYMNVLEFASKPKKGPSTKSQLWDAICVYFKYGSLAHDMLTVIMALMSYTLIGFTIITYSVSRSPNRTSSQKDIDLHFAQDRCLALLWLRDTITVRLRWLVMLSLCAFSVAGPMHNATNNMKLASVTYLCVRNEMRNGVQSATALRPDFAKKAYWQRITGMIAFSGRFFLRIVKKLVAIISAINRRATKIRKWMSGIGKNCRKYYLWPYRSCAQGAHSWASKPPGTYGFLPTITEQFIKCTELGNSAAKHFMLTTCQILRLLPEICCSLPGGLKRILYSSPVMAVKEMVLDLYDWIDYAFTVDVDIESRQDMEIEYNITSGIDIDFTDVLEKVTITMEAVEKFVYDLIYWLASLAVFSGLVVKLLYLHRYLKYSFFDNYVITKMFEEYDKKKGKNEGTGVLPLTKDKEIATYIKPTSWKLARKETIYFFISVLLLIVPLSLPIVFVFLDLMVWWGMRTVVNYFLNNSALSQPPFVSIKPANSNLLIWKIINNIVGSIIPLDGRKFETWEHCFVPPNEPAFESYQYMGLSIVLMIVLVVIDVFTWRLNSWICSCFYPDRAPIRAAYMHFEIITSRRRFTHAILEEGWRGTVKLAFAKLPLLQMSGLDSACPGTCVACHRVAAKENYQQCERHDCKVSICEMCYSGRDTCPTCSSPLRLNEDGLWIEVWDPRVQKLKKPKPEEKPPETK